MKPRARTIAACNEHAARQFAPWAEIPPVAPPVDVSNVQAFPEIARAIAGLAAMSPERRAQLGKEWE